MHTPCFPAVAEEQKELIQSTRLSSNDQRFLKIFGFLTIEIKIILLCRRKSTAATKSNNPL